MKELFGELTDEEIIRNSKQQCENLGIRPEILPTLNERFTTNELAEQFIKYREIIEVIHFFANKFLSSMSGNPILIAVTDDRGFIIDFVGDPSFIETARYLGITEGVRFHEEVGNNSIDLCLRYKRPIKLVGDDHYQHVLQRLACYSVPFYSEKGEQVKGTLSLLTDINFAHPLLLDLLCTMAGSIERDLLLRRQNTQLQMMNQVLLDTKYYGVLITDAQGNILDINEQGLEILRMHHYNELSLGSSVFHLHQIGHYFQHVIARHGECIGVELSIPLSDTVRIYMLDVMPVYDHNQTLSRVLGSLRDITEMKATEEVIRNKEKLVFAGQVAVSIAHEIRNPLTTVKGMLQLSSKDSKLRHYNLIMSELERINLIVGEFLILGKQQVVEFVEEQSLTILHEVLNIFEIEAAMNGIMIQTHCVKNAEIKCDRNKIKQVFLNILRNAMEALPFGGNIDIVLDVTDSFQHIRFTDNGVGMSEGVLQRIEEPFYTTKEKGNGLGMMIVKRIMDSHGGRVDITSKVGQGTSVEMILPIASK